MEELQLLRESDTDQDYDHCVKCSKITKYKKTDNVTLRSGYIDGAGQLCTECNRESIFSTQLHREDNYF